jgi:hypothetical protein
MMTKTQWSLRNVQIVANARQSQISDEITHMASYHIILKEEARGHRGKPRHGHAPDLSRVCGGVGRGGRIVNRIKRW